MAGIKFSNNAATTVTYDGGSFIAVADGSVFPQPSTGDYFYVTISDSSDIEIVKVTGRSSNSLTVSRAQEGTTENSWSSGDAVELRVTAAGLGVLRDECTPINSGDVTLELSTGGAVRLVRDDTYIVNGEALGTITFAGTHGGTSNYGSQIISKATATHSGSGWATAQLEFWTRNYTTNKQALTLTSAGKLKAPLTYTASIGYSLRDLQIDGYGNIGYSASVRASKTNITAIDDVEWLYDLTPVSFNYRHIEEPDTDTPEVTKRYLDSYYGETNYGLIAEDVEPVNDVLCDYDIDDDGNKTLAGIGYRRLVTPLLKALQDQKKLIDELTARLEALENS